MVRKMQAKRPQVNAAHGENVLQPAARNTDGIAPPRDLDTFPKLLRRNAMTRGALAAFRYKQLGVWQTWSWAQAYDTVRALAQGLYTLGLNKGETIAIAGGNRPKLYWAMTAAQMLGAVPVPVYADAVADELAYVLENAHVKIVVAQDQEQVDKVLSVAAQLPRLTRVLYDETRGVSDYDDTRLVNLETLIEAGRAALAGDARLAAAMDARIDAGRADDASVILYTSGTTGRSKGVVMLAGRCVAAATGTVAFDGITERDEVLAYLPLAWVGDHYLNYAHAFVAGFCMSCPESAETTQQDLREIGPSFYFAPPRVFEALLTRMMIRMEDAGALKRRMFHYFLGIAKKYGADILDRKSVPLSGRIAYALGNILVYGPLKNVLGFSRVRVAYTAGEAIGAELFSFYRALGLNLKQFYGQTEAFVYITVQNDGAIRSDAVGPAAPGVDIRIAPDGEVQFKSPGMFASYFGDAAKTAETMTPDGYIKTGDAGFFEPGGQLKIIDRARDVGKLHGGALFAPKYVENKLKFFPNIKEAVAFGDGRGFATVMLNIDLESVGNWAERNTVSYGSYQELAGNAQVYDMIEKHVDAVNRILASEPAMAASQIRRFLILHKELDPDDGELTRTLKVRRGFIAERYGALVDGLYNGADAADISTEVTFEDGRKGVISARVKIRDMATHAGSAERAA